MPPLRTILTTNPTEEAKTKPSPLGAISSAFWTKTSEKGSILDQPDLGLLEFYPAGYTKPDPQGHQRQDLYKKLYETAVSRGKEEQLYPFGKDTHEVVLIPDFENQFDKSAMIVRLTGFETDKVLSKVAEGNMGFVPMKISAALAKNRHMVTHGKILKVRNAVHGKYYSAKIILSYGGTEFTSMSETSCKRFSYILEE